MLPILSDDLNTLLLVLLLVLSTIITILGINPQFSAANFSKYRGPFCQILQLTASNFPHIPVNFLRPRKPTKHAIFVVGKLPQLTDTDCLPNKQAVFQTSSIFSILLTPELERQSCI